MYPPHLSRYVINEAQSLAEGYWKIERQVHALPNKILIVLDDNEHYMGVMTGKSWKEG